MSQQRAMDNMYRLQRHFYDATRKFYLLGRDALLQDMVLSSGDCVLEMACGTGRNLAKLQALRPDVELFGLDASSEMLKTARRTFERRNCSDKIVLRECLAEQLDHRATFGLERPFDAIFFSYGLSMIPTWRDALETALKNLKPGGVLYIVDFWDQAELPSWFRAMLKRWLTLFHVHFRAELLDYLEVLRVRHGATLTVRSIHRRYAYIATLALPQAEQSAAAAQGRELAACPM